MNDEKIKELLSVNFLRLIAERAGYVVTRPSEDFGDDLLVNKLTVRSKLDRLQFFTTGQCLCFQVKCTTEKRLKWKENKFIFNLKERNYNHLIERRIEWQMRGGSPLFYIVFVLPEKKEDWLKYESEIGRLILRGKAFWYFLDQMMSYSSNKRQRAVSISRENEVALDFFEKIFDRYQSK